MSATDAIPSAATGNALALVKERETPQDLVFYAGWFCPYVQRVWIALEEKGIPYQYKEEDPYKKSPEYLKISPAGLVPGVVYKGRPLHESLVILDFLEEEFPETRPLYPKDPYDRAQARLAIDLVSKTLIPNFIKLLQAQDPESQAAASEALYTACRKYGDQVKGPFWGGDEISLADIALVPWAGRFTSPELKENKGFDLSKTNPKFEAWVEHMQEVPSFKNTLSDSEAYSKLFARFMKSSTRGG